MFPLADARGRVRGFGARAMRDGDRPKYLNSADGPVYHKGRQLFGADHARSVAAKRGRVIVVEGYTDVLALHDAGIEESVAVMGTAMTDEQVVELARLAPRIYLALDADRAGRQAMIRAARVADAPRTSRLLVVDLPTGKDPADLIKSRAVRRPSRTRIATRRDRRRVRDRAGPRRGRSDQRPRPRAVIDELQPIFELIPAGAVKDEQMRLVAGRLKVSESALARAAQACARPSATPRVARRRRRLRPIAMTSSEHSERLFLAPCLSAAPVGPRILEQAAPMRSCRLR